MHWCAANGGCCTKQGSEPFWDDSAIHLLEYVEKKQQPISVCHDRRKVCCGLLSRHGTSQALFLCSGSLQSNLYQRKKWGGH